VAAGRRNLAKQDPVLYGTTARLQSVRFHGILSEQTIDSVMDKVVTNIVFTKNRPLQLEGYLRSLYRYFPAELIATYVIYKQELFTDEYHRVFSRYRDVCVVTEDDFHSDVTGVINGVKTKYILFGIDDVVFFDGVEFGVIDETFEKAGEDIFGFSLRFSPETLKDSSDELTAEQAAGQTVYKLDWTKGETPHTRYPFELCSTFYRTELVKRILEGCMSQNTIAKALFGPGSVLIKAVSLAASPRSTLKRFGFFYSPNTLESWSCRWCQRNTESAPHFTYFQKFCAAAVQVNMVNTTTANTTDGTAEHTVEALNDKYRQGYRLDIDYVAAHKPSRPGCGREHFRLVRM